MTATRAVRPAESTKALETIALLRKARGWSQEDLAQRAGVPRIVITCMETGRRDYITLDEAFIFARIFGVTIYRLARTPYRPCETCNGTPPTGFACTSCGAST